ncbi:hypothetical protein ACS8Y6_10540 [Salinisphaera sp. RV14]|uniref:hypothetical protein n=1 Tax=Salinisphaera sp. RV14 TaxID=3454140 RepID=UPI003F867965
MPSGTETAIAAGARVHGVLAGDTGAVSENIYPQIDADRRRYLKRRMYLLSGLFVFCGPEDRSTHRVRRLKEVVR